LNISSLLAVLEAVGMAVAAVQEAFAPELDFL
jgi:hypothetical protein